MPDFTITISTDNVKIITKLANQTSKTEREFLEYYIDQFCNGQIKGYFHDKIDGKTTAQLIALLGDIT